MGGGGILGGGGGHGGRGGGGGLGGEGGDGPGDGGDIGLGGLGGVGGGGCAQLAALNSSKQYVCMLRPRQKVATCVRRGPTSYHVATDGAIEYRWAIILLAIYGCLRVATDPRVERDSDLRTDGPKSDAAGSNGNHVRRHYGTT